MKSRFQYPVHVPKIGIKKYVWCYVQKDIGIMDEHALAVEL